MQKLLHFDSPKVTRTIIKEFVTLVIKLDTCSHKRLQQNLCCLHISYLLMVVGSVQFLHHSFFALAKKLGISKEGSVYALFGHLVLFVKICCGIADVLSRSRQLRLFRVCFVQEAVELKEQAVRNHVQGVVVVTLYGAQFDALATARHVTHWTAAEELHAAGLVKLTHDRIVAGFVRHDDPVTLELVHLFVGLVTRDAQQARAFDAMSRHLLVPQTVAQPADERSRRSVDRLHFVHHDEVGPEVLHFPVGKDRLRVAFGADDQVAAYHLFKALKAVRVKTAEKSWRSVRLAAHVARSGERIRLCVGQRRRTWVRVNRWCW